MEGSYNPGLVALSYGVAVAASYTALELSRRVSHAEGRGRYAWLIAGAASMGIGIWTMHFIGMLSLSLPIAFSFDVGITALSLLVAIGAAAFALYVVSRKSGSALRILASGLLLGAGIAAMHYTGMAAMRLDAVIVYDPKFVALSIGIAVAAACAALWIMFTLIRKHGQKIGRVKAGAALLMGVAICGMHYTGMLGVDFQPTTELAHSGTSSDNTWLASTIAAITVVIFGFTHLTVFFHRRLRAMQAHSQKAEQENVQLSEVLDESSNEIYYFDSESHGFVNANRGALNNLGYTLEEVRELTPLDVLPDYDVGSLNELLRPLRDDARNELLFETRHRRKDGSDYHIQMHLQLSRVTEPPIFVAIVTDVSERKELESQLMQAQKMQSIGQLAAGIAHEINTPAQFVGDNTRFVQDAFKDLMALSASFGKLFKAAQDNAITPELLDEVSASMQTADIEFLTDEVPMAIDQSLDGISRISNIVRAMKEFSHPGGKDFENVDLNSAIGNTITVASNEWKYVAEVETDFASDLPPVQCYQQEVNQVILNLIVNAAHAIAEKNGDNAEQKGVIRIATRSKGDAVEVSISDTGCGIPDDIRDRIFEPFFTTKDVGKGTGQGLAMAFKTIVDKHAGNLSVDSVPGEGTTFTIRLPQKSATGVSEEAAA